MIQTHAFTEPVPKRPVALCVRAMMVGKEHIAIKKNHLQIRVTQIRAIMAPAHKHRVVTNVIVTMAGVELTAVKVRVNHSPAAMVPV